MRRRDVDTLASLYLDGELDEDRASAFRGHLRTDADSRELVEDLAALVDAAASLESLDPPPALWEGVQRRLAEEEIVDSRRPRMWWWWRAVRPVWVPATVVMVAAALLLWWIAPQRSRGAVVDDRVSQGLDEGRAAELFAARAAEVAAADAEYRAVIAELQAIVATEREGWPAAARQAFDARVAAFEQAARQHQLAAVAAAEPTPARDPLYALYREEIAFLQQVALGEVPAGDAP